MAQKSAEDRKNDFIRRLALRDMLWCTAGAWLGLREWLASREDRGRQAECLKYAEVVRFFVELKPRYPDAARGGLWIKTRGSKLTAYFFLLDARGGIIEASADHPWVHKQRISDLDEELRHLFTGTDMVVFE